MPYSLCPKVGRRVATAAVAAAAAAGTALALAPAASAQGWVATATKALPLARATALSAPAASTPLRLTIGLAARNRDALKSLIKAQNDPSSAQFEQFLTPDQFTAQFAATADTANAVAGYLTSMGMTNVAVASNRLQVTAQATVAQAQKAFNTKIGQFLQDGKQVLVNTAPAQVPASLAGTVSAVLGLSTLGATPNPSLATPKLTGYQPKEFSTVYDSTGTRNGRGATMAVIAEGDLTQTITDLRTAEQNQGLRQVPVTVVRTGPASPDTSGADEWDLDTQTSTGVAPYASRLYIYDVTSLTNADLARGINAFAAQDVALSGSASLGECDALPFLDGSMVVDDMALAEAAAQGQTFFASSGDTGSACAVAPTNGVPGAGAPDTEYPASSTYATAVGGTTLVTDDTNTYNTEIAWNAGGGGISALESPGYWTNAVVPSAAGGLRGVPDVAFDADPNTGALIVVDGQSEQIGGTSLSSPLAMGLWTTLQSSHRNRLGFAPAKLYSLYGTAPLTSPTAAGFHDVLLGVNGVYAATPGWDYTTGLGRTSTS
jgi:pseudomonalisin